MVEHRALIESLGRPCAVDYTLSRFRSIHIFLTLPFTLKTKGIFLRLIHQTTCMNECDQHISHIRSILFIYYFVVNKLEHISLALTRAYIRIDPIREDMQQDPSRCTYGSNEKCHCWRYHQIERCISCYTRCAYICNQKYILA